MLTLRDELSGRTVPVEVRMESDGLGLIVCPSGYGCFGCEDGTAGPIFLEVYEGRLRLLVWSDINEEDPTHVIDLERARVEYGKRSREINLELAGGSFRLFVDLDGCGNITSNLHSGSFADYLANDGDTGDPLGDRESFGRYEGAVDVVESFVLAAAQAGMNLQGQSFRTALQTTLDAIGGKSS